LGSMEQGRKAPKKPQRPLFKLLRMNKHNQKVDGETKRPKKLLNPFRRVRVDAA